MNGKGRKINGDGDYYEGDWIDNKYHGKVIIYCLFLQGKYVHSNGAIYNGDWVDDV